MILIQNQAFMNNTKGVTTFHVNSVDHKGTVARIRQTAQVKQMWSPIKRSKNPMKKDLIGGCKKS